MCPHITVQVSTYWSFETTEPPRSNFSQSFAIITFSQSWLLLTVPSSLQLQGWQTSVAVGSASNCWKKSSLQTSQFLPARDRGHKLNLQIYENDLWDSDLKSLLLGGEFRFFTMSVLMHFSALPANVVIRSIWNYEPVSNNVLPHLTSICSITQSCVSIKTCSIGPISESKTFQLKQICAVCFSWLK